MTVAIIDYGSGNLRSAAKAFERVLAESGDSRAVKVTADPDVAAKADHIMLPGVGTFADCKRGLDAVDGMAGALTDAVVKRGAPFLGVCVGAQLMAGAGFEFGETPGLGWINGCVRALAPSDKSLKIPHMGWNDLSIRASGHPVLAGLGAGDHAYFVHSYHIVADDPAAVLATADYGGSVAAVVGRDNMVGTQFHPEKSQTVGLRLIANFLKWRP